MRFNLNSGATARQDRKAQQNEQDLQQQQLDQSGQNQMLSQIMSLYGLGQQARMAPEQLHALQLENAGRDIANQGQQQNLDWGPYSHDLASRQAEQSLAQQGQMMPGQLEQQRLGNIHLGLENTGVGQQNDWGPSMDQAKYDYMTANTDKAADSTGLHMKDALMLRQMGIIDDAALIKTLPPEMQQQIAGQAKAKRVANWPKIVADTTASGVRPEDEAGIEQNYPGTLDYLKGLHAKSFAPTTKEPFDPLGLNNKILGLLPAKRRQPTP